ncbi:nitroreductase family protein [Craterilacuibacter sinensis]|uniref:NADPH-dependent oxidoreductase n=1 Tax=Craterilacuibacter sinensis TaxID=2686017 RepID=A0A845BUS6_9NEIS|nr:nitroreductase family protein [Craterilacuibacter sinensis]MXR36273.1 NADPH-dependent oxidoreductase [Craterilacuibacter sinensis]
MPNPVIQQMLERRSIRNFSGAPVSDKDLQIILSAAQQAPTSVNGEQISLIVTRDKDTIRKIAQIAGGQPQVASAEVFITILIDFNRTANAVAMAGEKQLIDQCAEGLIVGAVDAGIMLQALQMAAGSLGYGTTAIGGIRNNPQALIELFGLPPRTFPLLGTTLGVADPDKLPRIKPRVPLESFALNERYDNDKVSAGIRDYDVTLRHWWDAQGQFDMPSYIQSTTNYYKVDYFPTVGEALKRQGFGLIDIKS